METTSSATVRLTNLAILPQLWFVQVLVVVQLIQNISYVPDFNGLIPSASAQGVTTSLLLAKKATSRHEIAVCGRRLSRESVTTKCKSHRSWGQELRFNLQKLPPRLLLNFSCSMRLGVGRTVKSRGKHVVRLGTIDGATLMLYFVIYSSSCFQNDSLSS
jgi:hypothetical protein